MAKIVTLEDLIKNNPELAAKFAYRNKPPKSEKRAPIEQPEAKPETGKCEICGQDVEKESCEKHVLECRAAHPLPPGKRDAAFYTLKITDDPSSPFFLYVEMSDILTLQSLDDFLRKTWLECCGHLSCFEINGCHIEHEFAGMHYDVDTPEESEFAMKSEVRELFTKGLTFEYEYDYGSTTHLTIEVVDVRTTREKIHHTPKLILRNTPPEWYCVECGAPATKVEAGNGLFDDTVYCTACARKNAKTDDMCFSKIKNSPRSGICGY